MGGSGSGRWGAHSKAETVEDGQKLPIGGFIEGLRNVVAGAASSWVGRVTWYIGDHRISSIGYRIEPRGELPLVRLLYTTTRRLSGEVIDSDYPVWITTTQPHYGGQRFWWLCPLQGCSRRVGTLYLPPGAISFGCRQCYSLSYESCQESRKYDRMFLAAGINKEDLRDLRRWRR